MGYLLRFLPQIQIRGYKLATPVPTLGDLRYLFFGGASPAEYQALQSAATAGVTVADLIKLGYKGHGAPEGTTFAPVGAEYTDLDTGNKYQKNTDLSLNTGWVIFGAGGGGGGAVTSVAGRVGAVVLGEGDVVNLVADLGAKEVAANKSIAGGYAPLDASAFVPVTNIPSLSEAKITNLTSDLTARELLANRGAASGYAPLDSSSLVPLANLPVLPQAQVTNLLTDLGARELTSHRGASNGYAPLDVNSKVPVVNIPNITEAMVTSLASDLTARELLANKGVASGYASLDSTTHVPASQISVLGRIGLNINPTTSLGNAAQPPGYTPANVIPLKAMLSIFPDNDDVAGIVVKAPSTTWAFSNGAGGHANYGTDPFVILADDSVSTEILSGTMRFHISRQGDPGFVGNLHVETGGNSTYAGMSLPTQCVWIQPQIDKPQLVITQPAATTVNSFIITTSTGVNGLRLESNNFLCLKPNNTAAYAKLDVGDPAAQLHLAASDTATGLYAYNAGLGAYISYGVKWNGSAFVSQDATNGLSLVEMSGGAFNHYRAPATTIGSTPTLTQDFNKTASGRYGLGATNSLVSPAAQVYIPVSAAVSDVGLVIREMASQTGDIQQWQNSTGTVLAKIDSVGDIFGPLLTTTNVFAALFEATSGGVLQMTKTTGALSNPGAGKAKVYFRDGTTGGTLKLVVRAGAAGAETTIFDNIPQ